MAFTKREKQILMGVNLEPLTGDEYALKRHVDELNEKELPAVTGSDNGKVLGVSGGVWGAVEPPPGCFIISATATLNDSSFTPSNIDKTPAQLAAAVTAKIPVFMRIVITIPAEEEGEDDIIAVQQIPLSQSIGTSYNFCSTPDVDAEEGLSVIKAELEADGDSFTASGSVYQVAVSD